MLQEPSGCCVPGGSFTTPQPQLTSYSTLQSHRKTNYQDCLGCNSRPSRLNITDNYASLRRGGGGAGAGLYPSCGLGLDQCQTNSRRLKIPSVSPSFVAAVSTGSSVVSSSELNHSVTTSDTSDISSERDRESEV